MVQAKPTSAKNGFCYFTVIVIFWFLFEGLNFHETHHFTDSTWLVDDTLQKCIKCAQLSHRASVCDFFFFLIYTLMVSLEQLGYDDPSASKEHFYRPRITELGGIRTTWVALSASVVLLRRVGVAYYDSAAILSKTNFPQIFWLYSNFKRQDCEFLRFKQENKTPLRAPPELPKSSVILFAASSLLQR